MNQFVFEFLVPLTRLRSFLFEVVLVEFMFVLDRSDNAIGDPRMFGCRVFLVSIDRAFEWE